MVGITWISHPTATLPVITRNDRWLRAYNILIIIIDYAIADRYSWWRNPNNKIINNIFSLFFRTQTHVKSRPPATESQKSYHQILLFSFGRRGRFCSGVRALLLIGVNLHCRKRLCYANMLLVIIVGICLRYVRSTANGICIWTIIIILQYYNACIAAFTHFYCFYYFIRLRGLDTQRRIIIYYYYYVQTISRYSKYQVA